MKPFKTNNADDDRLRHEYFNFELLDATAVLRAIKFQF